MALVRANKVHPPAEDGLIAGRRQGVQESCLRVGQSIPGGKDPRPVRQQRAEHGHTGGHAQRARRISLVKTGPFRAQAVEVRRIHIVAQPARIIGSVLVGHKDEDIRL